MHLARRAGARRRAGRRDACYTGIEQLSDNAGGKRRTETTLPAADRERTLRWRVCSNRASSGFRHLVIGHPAVPRGGAFQLTGTKSFISNAGIADNYIVFASTNPELRGKGISAFIIDANAPGLKVEEKTPLLSPHPIGVIGFDHCIVSENSLIGKEGQGLQIALQDFRFAALHRWRSRCRASSKSSGRSRKVQQTTAAVRSRYCGLPGNSIQARGNGYELRGGPNARLSSGLGAR